MRRYLFLPFLILMLFSSCKLKNEQKEENMIVHSPSLPYMGEFDIVEKEKDGKIYYDTVYHKIPAFSFINQDGKEMTEKDVAGKVYIADFFFTTCPSICPKMSNTLFLVQEGLKEESNFSILSHSIDPDYDSPEKLKEYAQKYAANTKVWQFLTGDKEAIYDICENAYMAYAKKDPSAEGGYVHSGFLILVDQNMHVRGAYDGTLPEKSEEIIRDVKILLHEKDTL